MIGEIFGEVFSDGCVGSSFTGRREQENIFFLIYVVFVCFRM